MDAREGLRQRALGLLNQARDLRRGKSTRVEQAKRLIASGSYDDNLEAMLSENLLDRVLDDAERH